MPVIHFINNKSQTTGGMRNVLRYVSRKEKTQKEDKQFVTAINCSAESCFEEFNATKNLYHKNNGRLYYHMIQSFPKGYDISPETAHKIAVELAEKCFSDFECVAATHIDREHIHSHFLINSVSFQNGKKYHSDKKSLEEIMRISDGICRKYQVHVLEPPIKKKRNEYISDREYRSAKKGESFKWELINAISQAMLHAKSKNHFCILMKQFGYGVRWESDRKYITYTCPNGRKCRSNKLHEDKFSKEMMEYEFKIRGIETNVQQNSFSGGGCSARCNGSRFKLESIDRAEQEYVPESAGDVGENVRACSSGGYNESHQHISDRTEKITESDGFSNLRDTEFSSDYGKTGWETERDVFLENERIRRIQAENQLENVSSYDNFSIGISGIVSGAAALASIEDSQSAEEVMNVSESKALKEEKEKKESLGLHM